MKTNWTKTISTFLFCFIKLHHKVTVFSNYFRFLHSVNIFFIMCSFNVLQIIAKDVLNSNLFKLFRYLYGISKRSLLFSYSVQNLLKFINLFFGFLEKDVVKCGPTIDIFFIWPHKAEI